MVLRRIERASADNTKGCGDFVSQLTCNKSKSSGRSGLSFWTLFFTLIHQKRYVFVSSVRHHLLKVRFLPFICYYPTGFGSFSFDVSVRYFFLVASPPRKCRMDLW